MQKVFAGLMSLGLLAVLAGPSDAWGGRGGCGNSCGYSGGCGDCGGYGGGCCQQYEVVWETRTVNVCEARYETREVMQQVCRCIQVQEQRTCTVMVPVSTPEARTVTCYHTVYSQEPRDIVVCRRVPVCCVDPCTGCCYQSCQTIQEHCTINVCVPHCVAEQKQVTVNVCHLVPQERTYNVCRYQTVTEQVPVKVCVCNYVTVPREVKVAVCRPVAAPAPAPCAPVSCYSGCGDCGGCGGCCESCCGGHHRRGGRW
jgi:hypothetical protein